MGRQLYNLTYTFYNRCRIFSDDSNGHWILITSDESKKAEEFIDKQNNKMFDARSFETASYLINGSVVKTKHATNSTPDDGGSYKIYSKTKKELKDIISKLGLPLR